MDNYSYVPPQDYSQMTPQMQLNSDQLELYRMQQNPAFKKMQTKPLIPNNPNGLNMNMPLPMSGSQSNNQTTNITTGKGLTEMQNSIGLGLKGLNLGLAYKNYGLANRQQQMEESAFRTSLFNLGTEYNDNRMNRAKVTNSLAGNSITQTQRDQEIANAQSNFMKTKLGG